VPKPDGGAGGECRICVGAAIDRRGSDGEDETGERFSWRCCEGALAMVADQGLLTERSGEDDAGCGSVPRKSSNEKVAEADSKSGSGVERNRSLTEEKSVESDKEREARADGIWSSEVKESQEKGATERSGGGRALSTEKEADSWRVKDLGGGRCSKVRSLWMEK
jgi:hypothetical protein